MYKVLFEKNAAEFFRKLDRINQERIGKKVEQLKENPHLGEPYTASLAGLWKLRVGDYRAIYQIKNSELIIAILKIGHRKNVYD